MVWCHIKVAHIPPGNDAYLNLNKEMIARVPIVNGKSNFKLTQYVLDRAYPDYQCNTLKMNNALVYQMLSKIFMNTDTYILMMQKKGMQDNQAVYFNAHKHPLGPDYMTRQTTEAERKLQTSCYDGERKGWDWDKYVALHKEQHVIMENLTDYGHRGMDSGTKVCHFLQGIKNTELEAVINIVWVQQEKYGNDFDTTKSYLGQMVTTKGT